MENIAKVSAALVRAQRAFGPALKTSSNPHFKSRYADLSACVEAVIDALNAEGIALVQRQHPSDGGVAVETLFVHESGEVFSSGILHMPATKQDAQGYGSALTYARRYSLMAAAGIAPEDDDGNAASKPKPRAIAPAREVAESVAASITDERRAELDEAALCMIETHHRGAGTETLAIYAGLADNDEKSYVWHQLASESKVRAFIKANRQPQKDGQWQAGAQK
jgi:predicted RecA/RadA family phage recombinase